MEVQLSSIHTIYTLMVLVILGTMVAKKDTIIPCVLGILLMGWVAKGSIMAGAQAVFNATVFAGSELMGVIIVISLIVAMSRQLEEIGANRLMVKPLARLIASPATAFWVVGGCMLIASWFFWPSPATALVGAVLLPIALRAGLPAIGVAVAANLFGHGLALSGDYIIQGAPTITAKAAGIPVNDVMMRSIPLVFIMGLTTIATAFWMLRRDMAKGTDELLKAADADHPLLKGLSAGEGEAEPKPLARWAAVQVPILFLIDIFLMLKLKLRGGDATALIGGTAVVILTFVCIWEHRVKALDAITEHVRGGMSFGIHVFGPILPIAGFFFLGELGPVNQVLGDVLPKASQGILSDMGNALANMVPMTKAFAAAIETVVGAITGLDGSGFSGMSLAGSLGKVFGVATNGNVGTLTALGQIAAIWIGGGTVVPWSIIPVAAICGVSPMALARRNFLPVVVGLVVTTVVAVFLV